MHKHTSICILIEILQKSFMAQLQSTVFLKYFALHINNHCIIFYVVQSLAYICLLLYNYHSLKRASNNVWNVLIELWLNCFNLSTALQSNHQNNFLGFFIPEFDSIKDISNLFRDTYWLEFIIGIRIQNTISIEL